MRKKVREGKGRERPRDNCPRNTDNRKEKLKETRKIEEEGRKGSRIERIRALSSVETGYIFVEGDERRRERERKRHDHISPMICIGDEGLGGLRDNQE